MTVQYTTPSWEQLLELARNRTFSQRVRQPKQLSSTIPISSSLHSSSSETPPPVLLYCDATSWHPFCEQVGFVLGEKQIPFVTEFIDLHHKPKWYTNLVSSSLVPAAEIQGELVCESRDILLALEEQFPNPPLLPTDPLENAVARQLVEDAETDGTRKIGYNFLMRSFADDSKLASLQASFEAKLVDLEQFLADSPSCYFLSTFSLADIMYAPYLTQLAESLPMYRNYHIKGNPRFPNLNAWFLALNERPAYHQIKIHVATFNLVLSQTLDLDPIANPLSLNAVISEAIRHRAEAVEWIGGDRESTISDILKNSGMQALAIDGDTLAVKGAIESHLKLLAMYLLKGDRTLLPWEQNSDSVRENLDSFSAAVGAITLAYIRNRICVPRDMSAGAASAFRAAAGEVLTSIY
jgi:glutathione S-transferase